MYILLSLLWAKHGWVGDWINMLHVKTHFSAGCGSNILVSKYGICRCFSCAAVNRCIKCNAKVSVTKLHSQEKITGF